MAFRNLRAILGPLTLPIGDKTYVIPPLPAEWGARLRLVAEGADDPEVSTMTHGRELELFLGSALDELREDPDVMPDDIERAFLTALADFKAGRASAERVWELGYDPELRAALMAAAEKALRSSPGSTPSPSSAKVNETQSPADSSPTTSPPATPPRARKTPAARPSAGRKSSSKARS